MASTGRFASTNTDLERDGYSVRQGLVDADLVDALRLLAQHYQTNGRLVRAGTGKDRSRDNSVRSDSIAWLEPEGDERPVTQCLSLFDELRRALNQELFLNLHDVESHFAWYPPGAAYQKHLDQFSTGDQRRRISLVLYLNSDWLQADGGELRLYLDDGTDAHVDISPISGRLVLFESSRFWHEVRPSTRDRLSIAGWFRSRS